MPSLSQLEREFEKKGQRPVILFGKRKNEDDKKTRVLLRRRV